jgi:hypothetical protein
VTLTVLFDKRVGTVEEADDISLRFLFSPEAPDEEESDFNRRPDTDADEVSPLPGLMLP